MPTRTQTIVANGLVLFCPSIHSPINRPVSTGTNRRRVVSASVRSSKNTVFCDGTGAGVLLGCCVVAIYVAIVTDFTYKTRGECCSTTISADALGCYNHFMHKQYPLVMAIILLAISASTVIFGNVWLGTSNTRDFNFGPPLLILSGSVGLAVGLVMLIVTTFRKNRVYAAAK